MSLPLPCHSPFVFIIMSRSNSQSSFAIDIGMKQEFASILLRHFKWNKEKLIENYMENDALVTEKAGLPVKENPKIHRVLIAVKGFACDICCSDEVIKIDEWKAFNSILF
jgi:hypothetical protein